MYVEGDVSQCPNVLMRISQPATSPERSRQPVAECPVTRLKALAESVSLPYPVRADGWLAHRLHHVREGPLDAAEMDNTTHDQHGDHHSRHGRQLQIGAM